MLFYLMFLNIYYWEKLTFSKLVGKVNFSERKFEEMHQLWRAKRHKAYSGKRFFGIMVFSCLSSTKPCLRFLLICFVREIKGFYQSSLENEVDFRDITNIPPQKKKKKSQKTETRFCRWKSTDNNDVSVTGKPFYPFSCKRKDLKKHF